MDRADLHLKCTLSWLLRPKKGQILFSSIDVFLVHTGHENSCLNATVTNKINVIDFRLQILCVGVCVCACWERQRNRKVKKEEGIGEKAWITTA